MVFHDLIFNRHFRQSLTTTKIKFLNSGQNTHTRKKKKEKNGYFGRSSKTLKEYRKKQNKNKINNNKDGLRSGQEKGPNPHWAMARYTSAAFHYLHYTLSSSPILCVCVCVTKICVCIDDRGGGKSGKNKFFFSLLLLWEKRGAPISHREKVFIFFFFFKEVADAFGKIKCSIDSQLPQSRTRWHMNYHLPII